MGGPEAEAKADQECCSWFHSVARRGLSLAWGGQVQTLLLCDFQERGSFITMGTCICPTPYLLGDGAALDPFPGTPTLQVPVSESATPALRTFHLGDLQAPHKPLGDIISGCWKRGLGGADGVTWQATRTPQGLRWTPGIQEEGRKEGYCYRLGRGAGIAMAFSEWGAIKDFAICVQHQCNKVTLFTPKVWLWEMRV